MTESPTHDRALARRWLGLAVGVLVLAGLFAVLLVVGRMPPFDRWITDPGFFRRCLVVHVDLSIVLWFYAFVTALLMLLPARRPGGIPGKVGFGVTAAGVALMVAAAGIPGTEPVLANYVPVIDHPVFALGLAAVGAGILATVLGRRLVPGCSGERGSWMAVPPAALSGLRTAGVGLLLAALTFLSSWLAMPDSLPVESHYELLFWGGGHVLQMVSVAGMVAVWLILVGGVLGKAPVGRTTGAVLFALLLLPWLASPLLAAGGTWQATYRTGFTRLMQLGIFPVVTVFLVLCARGLWRHGKAHPGTVRLRDPRVAGFLASVLLTVLGFVLGALIRGSNTMVPAHYHASIGAVTASFMAVTYVLLEHLGIRIPTARLRRLAGWQPWIFGTGQAVFALGFGFAGAHGMERKVYGAEQAGRDLAETLGLVVMGTGGLVAVAGGITFLWIAAAAWLRRTSRDAAPAAISSLPTSTEP